MTIRFLAYASTTFEQTNRHLLLINTPRAQNFGQHVGQIFNQNFGQVFDQGFWDPKIQCTGLLERRNTVYRSTGARKITENQTDSLGWLIALFAIGSGYLPLPLRKPDDGSMRDLAWSAIWSLHQDAGKERARKLLNKYMHTEPTFDNINARFRTCQPDVLFGPLL